MRINICSIYSPSLSRKTSTKEKTSLGRNPYAGAAGDEVGGAASGAFGAAQGTHQTEILTSSSGGLKFWTKVSSTGNSSKLKDLATRRLPQSD
ncbi:putative bifunctional glutamate/proline--tRNA ligase [Sesbania bispinosa]|nr:putative bifunctional glutamate/proline--tRNA ligase [Sesbania bispinosa]